MKRIALSGPKRPFFILTFMLVMLPATVLASSPEWRPTYDQIMLYVNFIILAAVIVKFGREPFKKLIRRQKAEVASEIEDLEGEKNRLVDEIANAQKHTDENTLRLNEMRKRLISQGEAKKRQIIDQAEKQSVILIEEAQKKMANRISQAKQTLKLELADMAFEQALSQLPKIITDGDNQRLLDEYMASANAKTEAS